MASSFSDDLELPFGGLYSNDDDGMYEAMSTITGEDDTFEFRHTLCDVFSDEYATTVDPDALTKRGDDQVKAGRLQEAAESYMTALEASPSNLVIAIRLMAILPDLGRGEEGAAVALASLRASECDEKLEKMARLQLITLYAKLGYGKKALEDIKSSTFDLDSMKKDEKQKKTVAKSPVKGEKVSKEELAKGIEKIIKQTPVQKELDGLDLESTLARLFASKENENPGICAFLFYHLKQHFRNEKLSKKETFWEKIENRGLFKNLNAIPALKTAFLRADFRKWSLLECCMVNEYLNLVRKSPDKVEKKTYSDIFSQEIFRGFLVKFGESLAVNDSLKFLAHCGTVLHFDIVTSWQQCLLELAKKEPEFVNNQPFNELNWHAKLIYAFAVGFYGSDYEELVNFKRMFKQKSRNGYVEALGFFEQVLKQNWFSENVAKMGEKRISEALNLFDMVLHVNFYSRKDMLLQPPVEKLMEIGNLKPDFGYSPKRILSLIESLLNKNRTLLPICRRRPGLWVHFSQRLDFLTKNMGNFAEGGDDLKITLNLLAEMLEIEGEIDGYVEDEDFVETVSKSFMLIMTAKVDEPTELLHALRAMVVRLVVDFSRISGDIPSKLAQPGSVKAGNIFTSFLQMKKFDAISAQFFYVMLKEASQSQLACLVNHPSMNTFLAKLLMLIYESKEQKREGIANICLCLMRTLSSEVIPILVNREILMQSILFSPFEEPQKLVTKLASFIRPTRRGRRAAVAKKVGTTAAAPEVGATEPSPIMPICAGLLLATLVKKDPIFRSALIEEDSIYGKVSGEYQKMLEKAIELGEPK